jgi:UDP-N-acetyl-D-galactosamine dehydrogenase
MVFLLLLFMKSVCVIGLGYVGLPLAVKFSSVTKTYGFDIHQGRVDELNTGVDSTDEVENADLKSALANLTLSTDPQIIAEADVIIMAIPTPVDEHNRPDLRPVIAASTTVAKYMKQGAIVVYESTVYPGCTQRDCIPVLERASGKTWKKDFFVGYSPERINPGDKVHTVDKIVKVVSGDTPQTLETLADLYSLVIKAGVHKAPSIKVAEAAKIIENTQRDVNIGLMNELKRIFDKMDLNIYDVLEAAGTKWNFLKFSPGLVGGHCIGVDPYYLADEAKRLGHHPELILAGRSVNDSQADYEVACLIKQLITEGKTIRGLRAVLLGASFKPNVPDTRNSKTEQFANELASYGVEVSICDPLVKEKHKADSVFGYPLVAFDTIDSYDAKILLQDHKEFKGVPVDFKILKQ